MKDVLGINLGTNSAGWAIVRTADDSSRTLVDYGVQVFPEGVAIEKTGEKPLTEERTQARAARRRYYRRRLRKIALLRILVDNSLCPHLTREQLSAWRRKKDYPVTPEFMAWQHSGDASEENPYAARHEALTRKLDLSDVRDRYTLGRALYHINQRRGYKGTRDEDPDDADTGVVLTGIADLTRQMQESGCRYLGEYFYMLFQERTEKIRGRYTSREEHYLAEFDAICDKQELDPALRESLRKTIFFQRPLASQKGNVGRCTFEKTKPRCQLSHPRYEEFRMLSFVNSIRVTRPFEKEPTPLTVDERTELLPLFFRKSKPCFPFEEIALRLYGKKNYTHRDETGTEHLYRLNYRMDTSVSGCPVTAAILSALDLKPAPGWEDALLERYAKAEGKTAEQAVSDIWHALQEFDDTALLSTWLADNLGLEGDRATSLAKTRMPKGYAALSLKAIGKILPWLRKGRLYSDAVFLANLPSALPPSVRENAARMREVQENVLVLLDDFKDNPTNRNTTKERVISDYLVGVSPSVHPEKLYHPSMIETFQKAMPAADGSIRLGSPRTASMKNPMAMRALFRLRALLNRLLDEGVITPETEIRIELARELNNANTRAAIYRWQRDKETRRKAAEKLIAETMGQDYSPSEEDIVKCRLWDEQNGICPYTGRSIRPEDFLGDAAEFETDYIIPLSLGGDTSLENMVLCERRYNHEVKAAKLPSSLADHEVILQRIAPWTENLEALEKKIAIQKMKSRGARTQDEKNAAIQKQRYLTMERDYWKGKLSRFTADAPPTGYRNRKSSDIGIISRYAKDYLKSVFKDVFTIKGATTAEFRKAWGLQGRGEGKDTSTHASSCIDAATIACVGKEEYDAWARYARRIEDYRFWKGRKPHLDKPWPTFTEDVLKMGKKLLVYHYTQDKAGKGVKKIVRKNGKIQRDGSGRPLYANGDTSRLSLNKQTYYGAIQRNGKVAHVIRKELQLMKEEDIPYIVDTAIREKVFQAVARCGSLKAALAGTIWANEEKGIPIRKVRVFVKNTTSPFILSEHGRDVSDKEYKRHYYTTTDRGGNYCMALYGEQNASFELFNAMDAANHYNGKPGRWIRERDSSGRPLRCVLKQGTMVLFYEKSREELNSCTQEGLSKRLYKVTGLGTMSQGKHTYAYMSCKHHLEARPSSTLEKKGGAWTEGERYRPIITILLSNPRFLVEGKDFEISVTGRVVLFDKEA